VYHYRTEITAIEALLLGGHPDVEGLCLRSIGRRSCGF
jgi:hypothetical protein